MEHFIKYRDTYSPRQEHLISQEFRRLKEVCYLDHAGSTLYSETQIEEIFQDFSKNIYSNPHAGNITSKSTGDALDIVRYQILSHYNTSNEEYSVVFTSGATAALKIIAECFDYGKEDGTLAYLQNNHTSVLGMRNFATNIIEVKTEDAFEILSGNNLSEGIDKENENNNCNSLFVYPAQCNFSGTKYPLTWIDKVKNGFLNSLTKKKCNNWYVVLDCASYVGTNSLDLSKYKPDFIAISFYKIFGYPTGLGALLVKKSSECVLIKKYFGGGTVLLALSSTNVMIPRTELHERFEDGTLPFLSILAVKRGFDTIKRIALNFDYISQHTFSLAQYVYRNLSVLHHSNGKPAVILYHDTVFENKEEQGSIVNFNILRPNGDYIGYAEVLHIANLHGIYLRTGCFCNPGACQRFLKLSPEDVKKHFDAGHVCGDQFDLVDGHPTGSVRVSFGYMSTESDANKFLNMIESCFVQKPAMRKHPLNWGDMQQKYKRLFSDSHPKRKNTKQINENRPRNNSNHHKDAVSKCDDNEEETIGILRGILVYPIKSCGAFKVTDKWGLTSTGLKYDREWMIVNQAGVCLTQKHHKKLCLITPKIDLKRNILVLQFKGKSDIKISLHYPPQNENSNYLCQSKVCGDRVQGWDCGNEISEWLSKNLEVPGLRLLRQCNTIYKRLTRKDTTPQLSLANKAQYLLINSRSVEWLLQKIPCDDLNEDIHSAIQRFRPNFIVHFAEPFQENEFDTFKFDGTLFKSAGVCTRCQMICINQYTGEISKEPLLTLSREFKGKVSFGVYLNHDMPDEEVVIYLGSNVTGRNRNC